MSSNSLSAAQQAQQNNRTSGGRYAEGSHAEAGDLQLATVPTVEQIRDAAATPGRWDRSALRTFDVAPQRFSAKVQCDYAVIDSGNGTIWTEVYGSLVRAEAQPGLPADYTGLADAGSEQFDQLQRQSEILGEDDPEWELDERKPTRTRLRARLEKGHVTGLETTTIVPLRPDRTFKGYPAG